MPQVLISIANQLLDLRDDAGRLVGRYPIATAEKGAGEQTGSYCTPRGRHVIRAKIGAGAPLNAVFVERRSTGEIFSKDLDARYPERDWILTRILWLSGLERGFNRGGKVDSMRRYIYIHGTPDRIALGIPGSKGCIRMRNSDIVDLFDRVPARTPVLILE